MCVVLIKCENLHVAGEASKRLVEVVHLGQDADAGEDHEDISRGVGELVVAGKRELEGDAKSLDGHDRDGADSRADGQVDESILLAVDRRNLVDHEDGEADDRDSVEKEA